MSLAIYPHRSFLATLLKSISFQKKIAVDTGLTDKINIFLTVNHLTIHEQFNPHDPAPIYKRQLSHQFEQYIMTSIESAKRNSVFNYRLTCKTESDKSYADPFIYAIKRHFATKKAIKVAAFEKFKRRSYKVLFGCLGIVMLFHGVVPIFLSNEQGIHSALMNGIDIFSWVILWQPIEKLVFFWNPHLKEISTINKLATAEVIITKNA
ncbi:MAG: hypothetical protein ABIN97_19985 [Ginsengibacter sp.]